VAEVFFPVNADECDLLLTRTFAAGELYGLARIEWNATGVDGDAFWVATLVDDAIAERQEDADGGYLGYRC
jgi:hypothetical protein